MGHSVLDYVFETQKVACCLSTPMSQIRQNLRNQLSKNFKKHFKINEIKLFISTILGDLHELKWNCELMLGAVQNLVLYEGEIFYAISPQYFPIPDDALYLTRWMAFRRLLHKK